MSRYFLILFLMIFFSCNSYFLNNETISNLKFNKTNEHQIIYYNETIEFMEDGEVTKKVHKLLKVGENIRSLPMLIYVHDNSIEKLIDYEAQIQTQNHIKNYYLNDLHTFNFSNSNLISENEWKILPGTDFLSPGDLIETVSIHEYTLPELGFKFSPNISNTQAFNIYYTIIIPPGDSLHYKIYNTSIKPLIHKTENKKSYTFKWEHFSPKRIHNIVQFQNNNPQILSRINSNSWDNFGKWYLDLIKHRLKETSELTALALEITKNFDSDIDKLNAIFNYVQKSIRYEQIYLDKGGFIPNEPSTIIKNKYGDCKDYSSIIFLMAHSLNIPVNLALCYRGRGIEFFEDIAVSQFNHLIINYNYNNDNYWYDGTNRTGIKGVPTKDLINQQALIVNQYNSHLVTIEESKKNYLKISGELLLKNENLTGDLNIVLTEQYAMDFFYVEYFFNQAKFKEYLANWIRENIGSNIMIGSMKWQKEEEQFTIKIECLIPNALVKIDNYYFMSLSSLFNEIVPDIDFKNVSPSEINYFPNYSNIEVAISLTNFMIAEDNNLDELISLNFTQNFSPGPYSDDNRTTFLNEFSESYKQYQKKIKLILKEH